MKRCGVTLVKKKKKLLVTKSGRTSFNLKWVILGLHQGDVTRDDSQ